MWEAVSWRLLVLSSNMVWRWWKLKTRRMRMKTMTSSNSSQSTMASGNLLRLSASIAKKELRQGAISRRVWRDIGCGWNGGLNDKWKMLQDEAWTGGVQNASRDRRLCDWADWLDIPSRSWKKERGFLPVTLIKMLVRRYNVSILLMILCYITCVKEIIWQIGIKFPCTVRYGTNLYSSTICYNNIRVFYTYVVTIFYAACTNLSYQLANHRPENNDY